MFIDRATLLQGQTSLVFGQTSASPLRWGVIPLNAIKLDGRPIKLFGRFITLKAGG